MAINNNNNNNKPNIFRRQAQRIFAKLDPKEVKTVSADWRLKKNEKNVKMDSSADGKILRRINNAH